VSQAEAQQQDGLKESLSHHCSNLRFAERAAAWAEIEVALRQFDGTDEFVVPHTYLIDVGTK